MISNLPNVRGVFRALSTLDSIRGPSIIKVRSNILIEGYYSSAQDMTFRRKNPDNYMLESQISQLPSNGVFVDCGANCGFYSALASQVLGNEGLVLSIEPSAREYRRLLSSVKLNSHLNQWIPLNLAAGDVNGRAIIDDNIGHTGMNRISSLKSKGHNGSPVLMMRLDHLFPFVINKHSKISLIKIDVEGFEYRVIRGLETYLKGGLIERLVVEVTERFLSEQGDSKAALFEYLKNFGYRPQINATDWQYDELFIRDC